MQLIHLAPPTLDWPHRNRWLANLPEGDATLLVALGSELRSWIPQAMRPGPAREHLAVALELGGEDREQLDRWFQALDWLGEVPADFPMRLRLWLGQRRAQQLARALGLRCLAADEIQPGMGRVVCFHLGAAGQSVVPSLARRLQVDECQFWLGRPAFFSADPSLIPQARLLLTLDVSGASELARLQGLELDPELLEQLAAHDVGVRVGWLNGPDWPMTRVEARVSGPSAVLGLAHARETQLITLHAPSMWRRPGFLAAAFQSLAQAGLSVDLLATSQTSLTFTLDPGTRLDAAGRAALEGQLDCRLEHIDACTSVHLVGRGIRSLLPSFGPALELFAEHPIHLVSQASSDVSLSLVVGHEQADRLLIPLHALLFGGGQESEVFGPTYQQLEARDKPRAAAPSAEDRWWVARREQLLELAGAGPAYVYDAAAVAQRADEVRGLGAITQAFYALKANSHPDLLALLASRGLGLECVSPGELQRAGSTGAPRLFTPNFVNREEYAQAFAEGCWVTLDNLEALRRWPDLFSGKKVMLRLDSGTGSGHHKHVRTAGDSSKFGISADHFSELRALLTQHGVGVLGLHCHAGSGITDAEHWVRTANFLHAAAEAHFPEAEVLNLGGGLGIPDRPGKQRLDFSRLQSSLAAFLELHPGRKLWLEPGRYLAAEAGVLVARVMQIKTKGERTYVGIETGMNSLIRPALYGAYHPIVNLTRWGQPERVKVDVVGPICESGDVLGHDRWMPATEPGDVLLIDNAGAYGASMASFYNLRQSAREVWLNT